MKQIDILGTEYTIDIDKTLKDTNYDGLCNGYTKNITIRKTKDMLADSNSKLIKKIRTKEVLRHEIVHAFFIESGLEEYSDNEQLIDWIAKQSPKILKAFQQTECI